MTPTDKMEMQVTEAQDGGATVTLPPEIPAPEPAAVEDDHDDGPAAPANDGLDNDPDREAIREARREERRLKKQIHREKARESNHLIAALRKQNEALSERLAKVERSAVNGELARVDKAIQDAGVQVEYAKMKMQEAVARGDGAGVTKSEELLYEARRKLQNLQATKQKAVKQAQEPVAPAPTADPVIRKYAEEWMERNTWYDPSGKNEESAIAQMIDKKLTAEGFDPTSEDYWDELDERLQKYIPNKTNSSYNDSSVRNQKPRSVVTSSGRESMATTKSNEFRLSPDRVAAMKEAGLWDNPALRQNAIRKYAEWDRQNKSRN